MLCLSSSSSVEAVWLWLMCVPKSMDVNSANGVGDSFSTVEAEGVD